MDYKKLLSSFSSYVYDKAYSPFFWVLSICFLFNHWDDLLVLFFSDDNVYKKIDYVGHNISTSKMIFFDLYSPYFYIINPLISSIIVSASYPLFVTGASYINDFSLSLRNSISAKFDSEKYLSKELSSEYREQRLNLMESFEKEINDHRKQLRESHQKFIYSQSNCAALYCALGFGLGYENLLPYSDLAATLPVKSPEQRDMLLLISDLVNNGKVSIRVVINSVAGHKKYHTLQHLNEDELKKLIEELFLQNSLNSHRFAMTGSKSLDDDKVEVQLSLVGRKFVKTYYSISFGHIDHVFDTKEI